MILAGDSETTGIDFHHGAAPYFITTCDQEDNQEYWEADVDPLTRVPQWTAEDKRQFTEKLMGAPATVWQNPNFDIKALITIAPEFKQWDWSRTYCTLLADHLIKSNRFHDLTTQALVHLNVDIQPLEDAIEHATKRAMTIARTKLPDWALAKEGRPDMPSAKEKVWKFDMWLPRAIVKHATHELKFSLLQKHAQQPTVGRVGKCHVRIDRQTKWGNPFIIGKDGTREDVIRKYAQWIWNSDLIQDLPELYGKVIGCHCCPEMCHGDVLRALCHPWLTVLAKYGNADSGCCAHIIERQLQYFRDNDLMEIYQERLKTLQHRHNLETNGVTLSKIRLDGMETEYKAASEKASAVCVNIAASYDYELTMPKGGLNDSLRNFVFDVMKLPVVGVTDGGKPSLNKNCKDEYQATLRQNSKELAFVQNLQAKTSIDTARSFMRSYAKYWIPVHITNHKTGAGWYRLFPSLNATGTDTLRWSSSNPNEQQISKKEHFNLKYLFGPLPGYEWWSLDYQNIELRIPAYESDERSMIDLFEQPNKPPYFGSNHLFFFDILHPEKWDHDDPEGLLKAKKKYASTWYQWTKNGDFAVQYGAVETSGTADRAYHVKGAHSKIKSRLGRIAELDDAMIKMANRCGYVETIPDKEINPRRGYPLYCTQTQYGKALETVPLNYHVQGTACWVIMRAMDKVQTYLDTLGEGWYVTLQIHDEIVVNAPYRANKGNLPKARKIRQIMQSLGDCVGIPLTTGIEYHAQNWSVGETCA